MIQRRQLGKDLCIGSGVVFWDGLHPLSREASLVRRGSALLYGCLEKENLPFSGMNPFIGY